MGTAFDRTAASLETSMPGVRQLQAWIRSKQVLSLQLSGGSLLEGCLVWQDLEFYAIRPTAEAPPFLVRRDCVAVLRPLA
jgi:hypothetical protein